MGGKDQVVVWPTLGGDSFEAGRPARRPSNSPAFLPPFLLSQFHPLGHRRGHVHFSLQRHAVRSLILTHLCRKPCSKPLLPGSPHSGHDWAHLPLNPEAQVVCPSHLARDHPPSPSALLPLGKSYQDAALRAVPPRPHFCLPGTVTGGLLPAQSPAMAPRTALPRGYEPGLTHLLGCVTSWGQLQ